MLAGIREILIITTARDQSAFRELLGDGQEFGVEFQYAIQPQPKGIAQAFVIGEQFLNGDNCMLVLGDNIFHGKGLGQDLALSFSGAGAHIFTYEVSNPSDYGVLEIDHNKTPISITEKPKNFISNSAITGLYKFDSQVSDIARGVKPSSRGEFEITSVLESYLNSKTLTYTELSRGSAWLDTGNPNSLNDAANYVRIIEERTGLKIGCLEEISLRNSWIDLDDLARIANKLGKNSYSDYLRTLV